MVRSIANQKAVAQTCSVKKLLLEISKISQENTCARVSFLIKLQTWACNFIRKEAQAQVFSQNPFLQNISRRLLLNTKCNKFSVISKVEI